MNVNITLFQVQTVFLWILNIDVLFIFAQS